MMKRAPNHPSEPMSNRFPIRTYNNNKNNINQVPHKEIMSAMRGCRNDIVTCSLQPLSSLPAPPSRIITSSSSSSPRCLDVVEMVEVGAVAATWREDRAYLTPATPPDNTVRIDDNAIQDDDDSNCHVPPPPPPSSVIHGSSLSVVRTTSSNSGSNSDDYLSKDCDDGTSSIIVDVTTATAAAAIADVANSNLKMQSVTENCLLYNSVTVPKIQRIDQPLRVAHNNSCKLDYYLFRCNINKKQDDDDVDVDDKCGALIINGQHIPKQKSDERHHLEEIGDARQEADNETITENTDDDCGLDDKRIYQKLSVFSYEQDSTMAYGAPLRLRGGGESSLNAAGTTGWGTPPTQQANNNNANTTNGWGAANPANQNNAGAQQWGNSATRPSNPNQGSSAVPDGANNKSNNGHSQVPPPISQQSNNSSSASGWGGNGGGKQSQPQMGNGSSGGVVAPATAAAAATATSNSTNNVPNNNGTLTAANSTTKQQLEQLNNMREAIFSQDGWGGQNVNQDTNWDIPGSPEPSMKMDSSGGTTAPWKPSVNNGTELWEANLRNGGQPPPQPQQKTPWGHTPSTNIGGTWGEDDESDSSNVWTGVPSGQQQWGGGGSGGASNNSANGGAPMWGGPKKESDWGNVGNSGWGGGGNGGGGDPRNNDPRGGNSMDSRDMRPDLRDMRSTSTESNMRLLDPRDPTMRLPGGNEMRGDPRGITGRLNAAGVEAFWNQTGPHTGGAQHMHHQNKMPIGSGGGGGGGGPGSNVVGGGGGTIGWEEPSPPSQRRNVVPNYDDGTSLWGNPQQGASMAPRNNVSGVGGGGNGAGGGGPPGIIQTRIKNDPTGWNHGRNGSWDDSGPGWGEDQGPWPPKQKMPMAGIGLGGGTPLWDNEPDWGSHKLGQKQQPQFSKEMVWNSKQFRCLVDMGFKKEEVENALRIREMNFDDALEMLSPLRARDGGWGNRHDDHFDHPQFPGQRFSSGPTTPMSFPPNNTPAMLGGGNMNNTGASNSLINNISPAIVQKMLTQGGGGGNSQGYGNSSANNNRNMQAQSQPSTQQLRMLVQQIQMAVQAGYLNHQILNQPLAPQTLVLLNQLLQQIKTLQQLANQQSLAQSQCISTGKSNSNAILHCSVLITKTKQQISNLQNQIAAQQAIYVKQQQHQGSLGGPGGGGGPSDFLKSAGPMHESINAMQTNFADLGIKDSHIAQPQSRLNQWINKDKDDNNEFSRAPGSSSKSLATSPNMNPLGLSQSDGPWSTARSTAGDSGWPDSNVADTSSDKDGQWPPPSSGLQPSLTDLVPEFEPGKPWKGTQIKSIEDDPSITPGSVVRSPLSIATIKDNELFSVNPSKSPPSGGGDVGPMSLTSSTWSFNPPNAASSAFTSPQSKLGGASKSALDLNPSTAVSAELWGVPKSRGPPPGLVSSKSVGLSNGWTTTSSLTNTPWSNLGSSTVAAAAATTPSNPHRGWNISPWLLLRNLTAQIDGSTLRTLCLQHGPLQSFHLYLHQGFALAKYSTREEATKAQTALNNCVLGNTTILAENPADWDANALLQQVASQQNASSAGWRSNGAKQSGGGVSGGVGANDTWASSTSSGGWSNSNTTANLWSTSALDVGDQARNTPSSLNSFLPGDLLGGESI